MLDPFDLLFDLSADRFTSGEWLARRHGVSRMAVCKAVKRLSALGVEVASVRGRGYRLTDPIELLDPLRVSKGLGERNHAVLDVLEFLPSVGSTNAYLMGGYDCADPARVAVLAEHQTAGRGRRGRLWESPFGANIYLSLRWQFQMPAAALGLLSLAVASEVAHVLESEGLSGHGVKWPNDILWCDRKLGGLLLELAGEQQGPCGVVIGLGLNWKMPASVAGRIGQPWVDLVSALGHESGGRSHIAGRMLSALVSACSKFEASGFEAFRAQWARFDAVSGREIRVHVGDCVRLGQARGIDAEGRLEVETGQGLERFASGEVSIRALR
jgi:BirA family biotin operon repressor/biotin-[acetyl-CoA-carboxylase] ligase